MFTATEYPVLDHSAKESFSVVPERLVKNDPPSENRVWNFSEYTTFSTEDFSVQVYETASVETGCSYDTASGRSILFFVDPYGLCADSGGNFFSDTWGKVDSWLNQNYSDHLQSEYNYQQQYSDWVNSPGYQDYRESGLGQTATFLRDMDEAIGTKLQVAGMMYGAYKIATAPPSVPANTQVYRQGTFADDSVGWGGNYVKGKQWAAENPLTTSGYAKKYGLPAENLTPDWVVGGRSPAGASTRWAPPSHNNPLNTGGGLEILPPTPNSVPLDWFHMP